MIPVHFSRGGVVPYYSFPEFSKLQDPVFFNKLTLLTGESNRYMFCTIIREQTASDFLIPRETAVLRSPEAFRLFSRPCKWEWGFEALGNFDRSYSGLFDPMDETMFMFRDQIHKVTWYEKVFSYITGRPLRAFKDASLANYLIYNHTIHNQLQFYFGAYPEN